MSRHSFDPEIAKKVGLNAAVIYQNIVWWCEKNEANGRNIHEGRAWTYNSQKAFESLFPYLSGKQIRTALDKLEEVGLILVGNFNKDARDRTKWYSLGGDCICPKGQMELPQRADTFALEGGPLPDSKPVINNTPKPPEGAGDLFSASAEPDQQQDTAEKTDPIEEGFEEFWTDIWPSHPRKTAKAKCRAVYHKACTGKHPNADQITPDELNRCARAYLASVRDPQFIKGTLPWLNLPGWEPFMGAETAAEYREEDLSDSRRSMLQDGICPPSMQDADGKPNAAARYWLKRYGHGGKS